MQHIGDCLKNLKALKRLKRNVSNGNQKNEILALLSSDQKQEVTSIVKTKNGYLVKLKSAYAFHGIKHALKNLHYKVKIMVDAKV